MVPNHGLYGKAYERKLLALEMDFGRSCGIPKGQRIPNEEIRNRVVAELNLTILSTINEKRLVLY